MSITVSLPWPDAGLSPNARSRTHHKKTRLTKKARVFAFWATKAAGGRANPGDERFAIVLRCYPATRRSRDEDNMIAHCKAYLDGIADALGVNDSLFRRPDVEFCAPGKDARIEVTIIPMEAL